MKKKILALVLATVIVVGAALGGTLAYLTDGQGSVNVATVGNVKIEQFELDRNGAEFQQGQPLYPAYYTTEKPTVGTNGYWENVVGAMDKVVTVKNVGRSDAYIRTWIALECPGDMTLGTDILVNKNEKDITWIKDEDAIYATIDGQRYAIICATYENALVAGETSVASLLEVAMAKHVDEEAYGGDTNKTYEILAFTQAVQTKNMPTETGAALVAAFGEIKLENIPWDDTYTNGLENDISDKVDSYNFVTNAQEFKAALEAGESVTLADDIDVSADETVTVANGTTLNLNGNNLTAFYLTSDGNVSISNGTLILPEDGYVYAEDGADITLENVVIDSEALSAYAATGGTLTLKNVVLSTTTTSNPVQNYGGTMILDGVTVSQEGDANTAWYSSAIQVVNQIVQNSEANKWQVVSQANATIKDGNYSGKKAIMISAPGGNVTINGGTFVGSEAVIQADFAPQNYLDGSNYESVITINGGDFTGTIKASKATEIYINGGTFNGAFNVKAETKLVITGGTFSVDPTAYVDAAAAIVKPNNDGTFTVLPLKDEWDGTVDTSWYNGNARAATTEYKLYTAEQLAGFAELVNNGTSFASTTINLMVNVDLMGKDWTPIGNGASYFTGTFNGNGRTVYNLKVDVDEYAGLFGYARATISNVNVNGAELNAYHYAGTILGQGYSRINNCKVEDVEIVLSCELKADGTYDNGDKAGGIVGQLCEGSLSIIGCTATDVRITGYRDIGGIVGYAHYNTIIKNNAANDIKLTIDKDHNYKNYKTDAEHDANSLIGDSRNNNITIEGNTVDGAPYIAASSSTEENTATLTNAITTAPAGETTTVALGAGDYKLSVDRGIAARDIVIVGSAGTVIDASAFYMDNGTLTIKNATITIGLHSLGSDYAGCYVYNATFENCTFEGGLRVGRDGAKFINCTFNLGASDYVYNYGNSCEFIGCTFNTMGKALLSYSDGNGVVPTMKVENCTFNATQKGYASAVSNMPCAAIEIDNYGCGVALTLSGNTYDEDNFSGEWRIKGYDSANTDNKVTINGVEYAGAVTLDGVKYTPVANYSGVFTSDANNYHVWNAAGLTSLNTWMKDNHNSAFWGKTYNIMADIDATTATWNTIYASPDGNSFNGITFDGNGHTISNLSINQFWMHKTLQDGGAGLFSGALKGSTSNVGSVIKDITFDNLTVNGANRYHVGSVWGEAVGKSLTVDNVTVKNSTIIGMCNVGGLVGRNSECKITFTFNNCEVLNTTVESKSMGDYAGASSFLGMALELGDNTDAKVVFTGTNKSEGNTLISAEGQTGGGYYTYGAWANPIVANEFVNYDSTADD